MRPRLLLRQKMSGPSVSVPTTRHRLLVTRIMCSNNYIKEHIKEILYISSAIVGLVCTVDAYFYTGKHVDYERHRQLEIIQDMNKTDKKILELIKELDKKVEHNSLAIHKLEDELHHIEPTIPDTSHEQTKEFIPK